MIDELLLLLSKCLRSVTWALFFFYLSLRSFPSVIFTQSQLLNMPRLTVIEGSVEDLIVSAADPEKPGKHRVTGVRLGKGQSCWFHPILGNPHSCVHLHSLCISVSWQHWGHTHQFCRHHHRHFPFWLPFHGPDHLSRREDG